MATLVYAPAIRVHIESDKHGIIDISDDITMWELTRRSNNPSSFLFTLQNSNRKYDGVFKPSDRITVELKRLTWVRVFTGSLNSVPIFSVWPRALPLSATCSLKKLQFWPWDPTTTESSTMIQQFGQSINTRQDNPSGDSGLSGLITESLVRVTNWDKHAIHIGAVPNDWFRWAQDTEKEIDAATSMAAVLGPSAVIKGQNAFSSISLPAGRWGNQTLSQEQCDKATQIFKSIASGSIGGLKSNVEQDRAALLALTTVGVACGFNLDPNPPLVLTHRGWYGMPIKFGTPDQLDDLQWSTRTFIKGQGKRIKGILDYNWMNEAAESLITKVVPGYDANSNGGMAAYGSWSITAQAIVAHLRKEVKKQLALASSGSLNNSPILGGSPIPTGNTGQYLTTGDIFAKVAYDLITQINQPPGTILYSQERGTHACDPTNPHPTRLDCSSLVSWCYYHATGRIWAGTNTRNSYPLCKIQVPYDLAGQIRGCLLYNVAGGVPEHTAISLGNGDHVAAHESGIPAAKQVDIEPISQAGCNQAWLHPDIDYTQAGTTDAAVNWLSHALGKKCTKSTFNLPAIPDPSVSGAVGGSLSQGNSDPFASLIDVLISAPPINGDIFGGARILMNNQPFLPWLGNLTNSTMRAYCSAPNGDFMAWFPDYFNVWKTAAVMTIRPIELMDFTAEWSDQKIVTHEYVIGSQQPLFDGTSGTIVDGGSADYSQIAAMLSTQGVATMDFPQIFKTIYGKPASSKFVTEYLRRFGGRPNVEQLPNIIHGPQEFYMALWMFMKHWAEQFNAVVPMTFMPELWPGMIIKIQELGFQAYVSEVTHRGSYGPNGQFTTNVNIIAPAPIDENLRSSLFGSLDIT